MKSISTITKNAFCLLFTWAAFSAQAQAPTGYYSTAEGKSGDALKSALNNIIKGHTEYSYTSSNTDVWDILKETDKDPNNPNNVTCLYSRFSMDGAAEYANGGGWTREHVWAKSRGDFGTSRGAGTDVHHIRAVDNSTNTARNNRNFGYATKPYVDNSGNYSGATPSFTSDTEWVWQPPAEVMGDVARMIFYMVVRYEGLDGEPDLELTETLLSNTDKSPFHAKGSVLLEWHNADPVDAAEIQRNNVIYSFQGNRNPFIDHPEYVYSIFGGTPPSSGGGGGGGSSTTYAVKLDLTTDNYGSETSWVLKKADGSTVDSGSGYANNSPTSKTFDLAAGDYEFTISDQYGDGICCSYGNGSYKLTAPDGSTIKQGGSFGSSEKTTFSVGDGAASGGGSSTPSGPQTLLALSNLSGSASASQQYGAFAIPSGASNLVFKMSGGSGDADLYVKSGSAPSTSSYDHRPYLDGNNETVTIASPQAGNYYAMIRGYSNYSGVSFTVTYDAGGGSTTESIHVQAMGQEFAQKQDLAETKFRLYPNPAVSEVNIAVGGFSKDVESVDLMVVNLQGKVLIAQKAEAYLGRSEVKLDVSQLPKGIYFVNLSSGKLKKTQRLIVQ